MAESTFRVIRTSWGYVGLAATTSGLIRVVLPQSSRRNVEKAIRQTRPIPSSQRGRRSERSPAEILDAAERQIAEYLDGKRKRFDLPMASLRATDFTRAVWRGCCEIRYGQTRSYGWLAAHIGRPAAMRAVGGALGANPLPLVVPCHRVIRTDGSLGGFGGGLPLKKRLLALEGGSES